MELHLGEELGKIAWQINHADTKKAVLILSHGAGAGMNHPFLEQLAVTISNHEIEVIRFNFPYMQQGKKSPGSPKKNIHTWKCVLQEVIHRYPNTPIFISGKSYGGRMASHLLVEHTFAEVRGLIYYGFPLHAPGKDGIERADHLGSIAVPQLFLQGSKDKLARIDLIQHVVNSLPSSTLKEITGGDHSFKVPKSSGQTEADINAILVQATVDFVEKNR